MLPESNKKDKPIDTQDLHEDDPKAVPKTTSNGESTSNSNSVSPKLLPNDGKSTPKIQKELRRKSTFVPVTSNSKLLEPSDDNNNNNNNSRISAYARLDFENFTFFVQTLQVVLGRKSNDETLQQNVDVHLSSKKPFLDVTQKFSIILELKGLKSQYWVEMGPLLIMFLLKKV